MDNAVQSTATLSEEQAELDVAIAVDDIEAAPSLSLEEIIMQQGRRQDGEVVVKLTDEQIKAKHDRFHEIYREQVLDNLEFAGLRKDFSLRKKTRESDMQQLDNCILRGEETQCITRWRIPAHKLKGLMPDLDGAEEAFIFDSDFNLIDRVPLTEMERQMQIEYEDAAPFPVPTEEEVAEILAGDDDSEQYPSVVEGVFEAPEVAEQLPNYSTFKTEHVAQNY